jgi:hypothetical protein
MEHEMTGVKVSEPTEQVVRDAKEREDRRAVYRAMIQHENDLRNQRLGWLFALNGFLFTAVGIFWTTSKPEPFLRVIAVAGAVASLSCWVAILAGTRGIRVLNDRAESERRPGDLPVVGMRTVDLVEREDDQKEEDQDGDEKPTLRQRAVRVVYPWNLVPWALAIAWAVIFAFSPGRW